jgi:DNA-binding IclR family transcriptional regulator
MEAIISRETAERSLAEACRRAHAEVVQFMVVPRRPSISEPWDGDEWLIEFAEPPRWRRHRARLGKDAELPRVASGRVLADALLAVATVSPNIYRPVILL